MAKIRLRDRDEFRFGVAAVVLAVLGFSGVAALVWAALMLWYSDFRRRFDEWYLRTMLVGLAAAALLGYPLSNALNIPPSWTSFVLVTVALAVAMRGRGMSAGPVRRRRRR